MNRIIDDMANGKELFFPCTKTTPQNILNGSDIEDAWQRLIRFSSYVKTAFPETKKTGGIIDSPLESADAMKAALEKNTGVKIPGRLFVKRDDSLAVCGSLKARGGIYTVFKHAEAIALKSGMLKITDDYSILNESRFRELFSKYKISVGSTGNLGMSIGLSGSRLGFDVTVYMSEEAKKWKKDTLKNAGVNVIEFKGDYTSALKTARNEAAKEENNFFIDDEDSVDLFLGYSAVCKTLPKQLEENAITADNEHPLIIWLPCGVGGGPGGITFGLKSLYKNNVYCFFGEPTQMPCMALAMASGSDSVSVYDIGLKGKTVADGLACSSPSALAAKILRGLINGNFTVNDDHTLEYTKMLFESTGIKAEPSSCLSFGGLGKIPFEIDNIENASNIVWLTGGSLVPDYEWEKLGI